MTGCALHEQRSCKQSEESLQRWGETVRQEDWQALRKVIAGVLPEPIALQTLRQRDQKRAAERASEAICELQRVVHEALLGRWEATGERRRAADAARAEDASWRMKRTRQKRRGTHACK